MLPIVGLVNDASVCYLNSLLQCLMANEKFNKKIKNGTKEIDSYINLLNKLVEHHKEINRPFKVNPTGFKKNIFTLSNLNHGQQEDADETLVHFLDHIGDNNKYFKNTIRTYTKCMKCGYFNNKDEEMYQLYLDVPIYSRDINLHNCLNDYIKPDDLQDYKCDKCDEKNTTKKALLPINFGDNIVFVIKQYQRSYRRTPLVVQKTIEMGQYLFNKDNKLQKVVKEYELTGGIIHLGSMNSGHYRAVCKKNGDWYLFDDEHIEKLENLGELKNAYMLFYESLFPF